METHLGTRRYDPNHSQRTNDNRELHENQDNHAKKITNITYHSPHATQRLAPQTHHLHTIPINPDLESAPIGSFEITRHLKNNNEVLLQAPDGILVNKMTKARL